MSHYSEKEQQMFAALGKADWIEIFGDSPVIVYRMLVEQAFLDQLEGPAVDSLRRTYGALRNCSLYRNTTEFDNLIQL